MYGSNWKTNNEINDHGLSYISNISMSAQFKYVKKNVNDLQEKAENSASRVRLERKHRQHNTLTTKLT